MHQQQKPKLVYGISKAEAARRRREMEASIAPIAANDGIFAALAKAFAR